MKNKNNSIEIENIIIDACQRGYIDGQENKKVEVFRFPVKPKICHNVIQMKVVLASFPFMIMRSNDGYLYRFNGECFQTKHGLGWRRTRQYAQPPYWPYEIQKKEQDDG